MPKKQPSAEYVTVTEAARIAGLHRQTIYALIDRGELEVINVSWGAKLPKYMVNATQLRRMVAERSIPA